MPKLGGVEPLLLEPLLEQSDVVDALAAGGHLDLAEHEIEPLAVLLAFRLDVERL